MITESLEQAANHVADAFETTPHVWVTGPEGSGRSTVGRILSERWQAPLLELPPLNASDVASATFQLAAAVVGLPAGTPVATASGQPSPELLRGVGSWDRAVLVRLHGPIPGPGQKDLAMRDHQERRTHGALQILNTFSRVVWLSEHKPRAGFSGPVIDLPALYAPVTFDPFEGLEGAAADLARLVGDTRTVPLAWRLAVGAVSLGAPVAEVAAHVCGPAPGAVPKLANLLGPLLSREPSLRDTTRRLFLVRTPLPGAQVVPLVQAEPEHRALVTSCLGYGEPLRVNRRVNALLTSHVGRFTAGAGEDAHAETASAYEVLDGAAQPLGLPTEQVSAWIEKMHHLASGGTKTVAKWSENHKDWPDLYWERGRYFSAVRRKYEAAAEIYRRCLEAFPEDDYSHHYYAWNLKKARGDAAAVTTHFARAVALYVNNPWWNAHYITHLIDIGEWRRAKAAWNEALRHIDPAGTRAATDAWLIDNLHYVIAGAWMKAGVWYEARAVIEGLGRGVEATTSQLRRKLKRLQGQIAQAEAREWRLLHEWLANRTLESATTLLRHARGAVPGLMAPAVDEGEEGPILTWSLPSITLQVELDEEGYAWAGTLTSGPSAEGEAESWAPTPELLVWLQRARHG